MSTFVGDKDTKAIKVGTKEVSAVYVGAQQIWPDGPPPLPEVLAMGIQMISGGGGTYASNPNGYGEGGGGGGGFKQEIDVEVQPNVTYPVLVGAGGTVGQKGSDTSFDRNGAIDFFVMGGASSHKGADVDHGGSGGGGRAKASKGYPGGIPGPYGCYGGTSDKFTSAGGGGAGAQPPDCTEGYPSKGGIGLQCWDLVSRAGGGGAACGTNNRWTKGNDGGGDGGYPGRAATAGINNTGGGGGGGTCTATQGTAGVFGGSGIVLIKTTWKDVTTTGSVTKTDLDTGEFLHIFEGSGSVTFNQ